MVFIFFLKLFHTASAEVFQWVHYDEVVYRNRTWITFLSLQFIIWQLSLKEVSKVLNWCFLMLSEFTLESKPRHPSLYETMSYFVPRQCDTLIWKRRRWQESYWLSSHQLICYSWGAVLIFQRCAAARENERQVVGDFLFHVFDELLFESEHRGGGVVSQNTTNWKILF